MESETTPSPESIAPYGGWRLNPARAAKRALVRAWLAVGAEGFDWIPRPPSGGHVFAPGRDPLQVLLVGGGPAVGWGVASHDLGLAGFMARELAAQTLRGVDVLVVSGRDVDVRSASEAMAACDLARIDYVVLTLGVEDAVRGIRPSAWRTHFTELLQRTRGGLPAEATILAAGIQPIRSVPAYDHPIAASVDADAARLNAITATTCASTPGAVFVPFPAGPASVSGPRRTPKNYPYWGGRLARAIAAIERSADEALRSAAAATQETA